MSRLMVSYILHPYNDAGPVGPSFKTGVEVSKCCLMLDPPPSRRRLSIDRVDVEVRVAGAKWHMDGRSGDGACHGKNPLIFSALGVPRMAVQTDDLCGHDNGNTLYSMFFCVDRVSVLVLGQYTLEATKRVMTPGSPKGILGICASIDEQLGHLCVVGNLAVKVEAFALLARQLHKSIFLVVSSDSVNSQGRLVDLNRRPIKLSQALLGDENDDTGLKIVGLRTLRQLSTFWITTPCQGKVWLFSGEARSMIKRLIQFLRLGWCHMLLVPASTATSSSNYISLRFRRPRIIKTRAAMLLKDSIVFQDVTITMSRAIGGDVPRITVDSSDVSVTTSLTQ